MSDTCPAPISKSLNMPRPLAAFLLRNKYTTTMDRLAITSSVRTLVFTSTTEYMTRRVERVALVQAEDTERLKVFDGVVAAMEHWDESSEMLFETIAEAVENMK